MVNLINTIVYAGCVNNGSVLLKSSSGGAFTFLFDDFFERRLA